MIPTQNLRALKRGSGRPRGVGRRRGRSLRHGCCKNEGRFGEPPSPYWPSCKRRQMTNAAKPYTTAEGVTSKIDAVPAPPAFEFHRLRAAQAGISGYGCFAAHQMEMQHSRNHLCPHSPKMKFPREDKMYVTITPGTRVRCRSPFDYMHSISGGAGCITKKEANPGHRVQ